MNRIVKDPEIRRLEIMEAAQRLFEQEGYTKTTIEAIIKEAQIAKGTFYYYFKSKQEILGAIVENIVSKLQAHFVAILNNEKLSALDKLKEMIIGSQKRETVNHAVMEIIHLPENRELQEQLNIQSILVIAPLMTQAFVQGYQEGIFKIKASLESIQLILAGFQFVLDSGLFTWSQEKRVAFLSCAQKILEQSVGALEGTFSFIVSNNLNNVE